MPDTLPVVLLPGVMGSRLYLPRADRFWDPDRPRRMAWWAPVWPLRDDEDNRRDLDWRQPGGVVLDTADVTPARRDRGWSTVIWSFYGEMLERLARGAGEGRVFAVGYDWRQDIGGLGLYAAAKIREYADRAGAGPVAVVTHSMGGLVLRAAVRVDPTLAGRLGAVIHVCQPSAGAVILYRRLFTGLVRGLDGGGGVADRAFRLLLGNTRKAFLGNMSGMPGPMQLLPSGNLPAAWHPDLGAGTPFDRLYENVNSPPGVAPTVIGLTAEVLNHLRERLADVAAFHALLAQSADPPAHLIHGVGRPTEVRFNSANPAAGGVDPADGDEVVPAASAVALGQLLSVVPVAGVKHAEACAHNQVQDAVAGLLFAAAPVPATPSPAAMALAAPAAPPAANGADVAGWLRAVPGVAAALGVKVRVTVEAGPPGR